MNNNFFEELSFPVDGFPRIAVYKNFDKDLSKIISKSGKQKNVAKQFLVILKKLEEFKEKCITFKEFEKLRDIEIDLYSIRFLKIPELNLRILFVFKEIEPGIDIVFLDTFLEKNKSDYDNGVKRSINIYKNHLKDL